LKSTCTWIKNYQSIVDNGRNHAIVIDLPKESGGDDQGPTALELAVMGLSGCIGTIFALVASKMRVKIEKLIVEVTAEKGDGTIISAHGEVKVKADASEEKIHNVLKKTLSMCPVGLLYKEANIPMQIELTLL